jgi:hypothetical protein
MDFVVEAKKFSQRAVDAENADVIREHLKIADWCLDQEILERDERAAPQAAAQKRQRELSTPRKRHMRQV